MIHGGVMDQYLEMTCPACHVELHRDEVRNSHFDCPRCNTTLRPVRSQAYRRCVLLFTAIMGFVFAWRAGWHDSFMVFVFGFYYVQAHFLWWKLEAIFFPPKKFRQVVWYPGQVIASR